MEKAMFADIPRDDRIQLLKDNCDSSAAGETYMRDLTGEEVDARCELFVNNCIEINRLEEELKELKDRYKEKMAPLKDANKELVVQVKTRKEEKKGILFNFFDQAAGTATVYDEYGEFVILRRLKPEEKQARLFIERGGLTGTTE